MIETFPRTSGHPLPLLFPKFIILSNNFRQKKRLTCITKMHLAKIGALGGEFWHLIMRIPNYHARWCHWFTSPDITYTENRDGKGTFRPPPVRFEGIFLRNKFLHDSCPYRRNRRQKITVPRDNSFSLLTVLVLSAG